MEETKRMTQLFADLYDGNPWIDVTITGSLAQLSAETAARRVLPGCNTIWEIVNHLISWRENVLRRIRGNLPETPADNYFAEVGDTSETAWKKILERLAATQQDWTLFLSSLQEADLDHIYPNNGLNYYEHIHGIIQHDAYHLGQIMLLAKL